MLRVTLLFMAILALPLKAATMTNLYQAQVVLPDTDRQSEQVARKQALEQVLIKVSGQSAIVQNEVIAKALTTSSQYVSQFAYGNLNGQQTLDLSFEPSRIRNLLAQAHSTFWSEQRPSILVWLVEDASRERNIIWDQSGSTLLTDIKAAAERRGVPVLMPIGDFEDVTAISTPDLWGGFVQPIAAASLRYQPDAVLVVRVRQQDNNDVALNWQLFADKPAQLNGSQVAPTEGRLSGTAVVTINQMMDSVADQLATKYAVPLGGDAQGQLSVVVGNIKSSKDFFTLERLITRLTSVAAVNAYRIQGDSVEFSVQLLSTEAAFQRELSQDRRLSVATTPVNPVVEGAIAPIVGEAAGDAQDLPAGGIDASLIVPQETQEPAPQVSSAGEVSATSAPAADMPATGGVVTALPVQPVKQATVYQWSSQGAQL
ncbi:DUF2066 domain-containing protein [Photobacterium nomapromontoriensis]|uniref:DUF2066 domain-containing protein n=1 Tax=Photobacterium nomapromontoriensis TaxID=2910237 RepID=UPI003D0A6DDE